MSKMLFADLLVVKDGLIKGPFGGDIKKSLFVPKGKDTLKVYEQGVVLKNDINHGTYYISKEHFESKLKRFEVKTGDLLMTGAGTLGELITVPENAPKGVINQALLRIRLNQNVISTAFFKYYFKYYIKAIISKINGDSVIPNLPPLPLIRNTEVDIPDTSYQNKISSVLSALDSKIELNNRINSELEAMAKTLYDYWFVQFDFPDKNGNPYKSSGGKMVWNEELKREIPEGWEVKLLGTEIEIQRGISYTSKEINGDGIPMISLNSFNLNGTYKPEGIKKYSGKYTDKNNTKPGDLLIAATDVTRNADIIGRAILVPDYYNGDLVFSMDIAKIISKNIPSSFLMMLFNSNHYHNYIKWYASGTIVLHLNLDGTKRYNIELPPRNLLQKYDSLYQPIADRIYKTAIENQKLAELRDWLLPMLMNGQVRVD